MSGRGVTSKQEEAEEEEAAGGKSRTVEQVEEEEEAASKGQRRPEREEGAFAFCHLLPAVASSLLLPHQVVCSFSP